MRKAPKYTWTCLPSLLHLTCSTCTFLLLYHILLLLSPFSCVHDKRMSGTRLLLEQSWQSHPMQETSCVGSTQGTASPIAATSAGWAQFFWLSALLRWHSGLFNTLRCSSALRNQGHTRKVGEGPAERLFIDTDDPMTSIAWMRPGPSGWELWEKEWGRATKRSLWLRKRIKRRQKKGINHMQAATVSESLDYVKYKDSSPVLGSKQLPRTASVRQGDVLSAQCSMVVAGHNG